MATSTATSRYIRTSAQKAKLEGVLNEITSQTATDAYAFRPCIVAGPDALALLENIPYIQLSEKMPSAVLRALSPSTAATRSAKARSLIGSSKRVAARVDADMSFHRMIYELSNFSPLIGLWDQIELLTRRMRPVSSPTVTYEIHRTIFEALRANDTALLDRAIEVHMRQTWSPMVDHRLST